MLQLLPIASAIDRERLPAEPEAAGRRRRALFEAFLDRTVLRVKNERERASHWNACLVRKENIGIRVTDVQQDIRGIETLVSRLYRQRGYRAPQECAHADGGACEHAQIVLEACSRIRTVGTLTLNVDGPRGLKAEELFESEIAPFRRAGTRLCEFTRLALELDGREKQALACLFHTAYIFAYRVHHASDLFIEVHPRHAAFYRRRLRFSIVGEQKICRRVGAPAVLLHRNLRELSEDLMRLGGFRSRRNKSFLALGLAPWEESEELERIRQGTTKPVRRG